MADGMKQYEIVFLLKAALDSSMNQFSVMGGKIKELEEKIQQYRNTMRDIEAFQRQQTELQKLEQEYARTQTQLQGATRSFAAATAQVKTAEQAVQQHTQNIDRLNVKIAEEKSRIAEIHVALKQEGADTRALNIEKAEHKAAIEQIKESLTREKIALLESKEALNEKKAAEKSALEQKNALQNSSDRLREKIGQEKAALTAAAEALQKMGVDTKDLDAAMKKLNQDMSAAKNEMDQFAAMKNAINGLANQFMAAKMAADGILPTLKKVNEFFGDSIRLAADLEYSMSSVEAISGASATEMDQLAAVAKQMGAATRYTALEAAGALQTMALAGWEAESMAAALPGVVNLAAAANEDLAQMTTIVVDGMNAFGMAGTKNAQKFADVLAKAATSSSTTVAQLGDALKACQGTAGNLGYSIEDVSAVLAAMANNGLKAAVSGTSLNTLLTRLSGGIQQAEDLLSSLGVSMYYTSDAFGHAAGEAKPLIEFISDLRKGFQQFGDNAQEAQVAAYKLAGMRGMKGLLSIINMSDESWQKLVQDVYAYSGAAKTIASISMDNYQGQLYLLTSAWDALRTSVGEKFLPTATGALEVLTDITSATDRFVQNHGDVVRFIAGTVVAAKGLLTVLGGIALAIQGIHFAMNTLELGKLLAVVGGVKGLVAIAVTAGIAFAALTSEQEGVIASGKELLKTQKSLNKEYESSIEAIEGEAKSTGYLLEQLRELSEKEEKTALDRKRILNLCEQLNQAVPELALSYNEEADSISGLTGSLEDYVKGLYDAKRQEEDISRMSALYGNIKDTEAALEEAQETLKEYRKEYESLLNCGAGDLSAEVNIHQYEGLVSKLKGQLSELQAEYDGLLGKYSSTEDGQKAAAGSARDLTSVYEDLHGGLEHLAGTYTQVYQETYDAYSSLFDLFAKVEEKTTTMSDLDDALKSQLDYFTRYEGNLVRLKEIADGAGIDLSGIWGKLSDGSLDSAAAVQAMWDSVKDGDTSALKNYVLEYNALQQKMDTLSQFVAEQDDEVKAALDQAGVDIEAAVRDTEAKEAAIMAMEETFSGYLLSIEGGKGRVGSALDGLAKIIRARIAALPTIPSVEAEGTGTSTRTAGRGGRRSTGRRFASGTSNAPAGIALVGENGPELMIMQGGEKILNAMETRQLRREAVLLQKAMPDCLKAGFQGGDSRTELDTFVHNVETIRQMDQIVKSRTPPDQALQISGYASGTSNAPAGIALVGENGPELMVMQGGEKILPANETAQIIQAAQRRTPNGSLPAADREAITRKMETNQIMRTAEEKTAGVLRAITETEKTIRETETARLSSDTLRMIRAEEERSRNIRTEDEISRMARIVREASGSRTETEAAERILRTSERNASIIREMEAEKTSDSVFRLLRAAEQRTRNILKEDGITRIFRSSRSADSSASTAERAYRFISAAEDSTRTIREAEAERVKDKTLPFIRQEERTRNTRAESVFSRMSSIIRKHANETEDANVTKALRILQEKEETERIIRRMEAIQEAEGGDPYQYDPKTGAGPLDIAAYGGGDRGAGEGPTNVYLNVEYNVSGCDNMEDLKRKFRENDKALEDLIRRVLREEKEKQRRRAFV